ncbi:Glutathione-dependent formaldehyde-activating, GFA [Trichoderma parareesei]|uniref:Glutathione-dependent formaldehyde-activating, GFA n=1 Tax=Trichoderma parareesei TaxID=858221 RepID=A0A2H2ZH31_TRIPA|nr:Glutathione-dependent formaldehyde-activating, GFA [Trichoderma parareesei]
MTEPKTITYRGNCHCGAFVFQTSLPEIKSAIDCNCSICAKKGYLWIFPGKGNVEIVKGSVEEGLTAYEFGPKKLKHLFCPKCASPVGGFSDDENFQLALNAHCFQGLVTSDLEKPPYDGASLGEPYEHPVHKGALPTPDADEVVYTGSCHCGAVTIATASKPLDETYEGAIECNCSSCERHGCFKYAAIWVYRPNKAVVLSGDEANIGRYQFNRRMLSKVFCNICGVVMANQFNELTSEQVEALPELPRRIYDAQHEYTGVNARVLQGVDVGRFKTKKVDGLNKIPGEYANP